MQSESKMNTNFFLKADPKQWLSLLKPNGDYTSGLEQALRGDEIVIYSSDESSGRDLCKVMIRCSFGICQFVAYLDYDKLRSETIHEMFKDVEFRDECFHQVSLTPEEINTLIEEEFGMSALMNPVVAEVYQNRLAGYLMMFAPEIVPSPSVKEMWKKDAVEKKDTIVSTYEGHIIAVHPIDNPELFQLVFPIELCSFTKRAFDNLAQFEGESYTYMSRHCQVWGALLDELEDKYEL